MGRGAGGQVKRIAYCGIVCRGLSRSSEGKGGLSVTDARKERIALEHNICFGAQQEQQRWPKVFVPRWGTRSIRVSRKAVWMRCTQREGQRQAGDEAEKL